MDNFDFPQDMLESNISKNRKSRQIKFQSMVQVKTEYVPRKKHLNKKDLGFKDLSDEQFQAYARMFEDPTYSGNEETVRMVAVLGDNPEMPKIVEYDVVLLNDSMSGKELLEKWYLTYFGNKPNPKNPDEYVIIYEQEKKVTAMFDHETVWDFKNKIGVERLSENSYFFVYEQEFCPYHEQQCAMTVADFGEFEKKYNKGISIPIKVLLNQQKSYYFYIESINFDLKIKDLREMIPEELTNGNQNLKFQNPLNFTLYLEKNQQQMKNAIRILETWKVPSKTINQLIVYNKLVLSQATYPIPVRRLCAPGEIIYLQFSSNYLQKNNFPVNFTDCEIRIKYYETRPEIKRRDIVRRFSEIQKVKVATLLNEEKIDEPLTTCLYLNGVVIRPTQKFGEIPQIQQAIKMSKVVELACVTDNLVFYEELWEISRKIKKVTIEQLLNEVELKKELKVHQNITRSQYRNLRIQRQKELMGSSKVRPEHKNVQFFDPIMLYTTPLIYGSLNYNLRTTSISLFSKQNVLKECWHYKMSEKIVSSMVKLDSCYGINVYRGSSNFQYNYRPGQIVQFSGFTSTSKRLEVGVKFTQGGSHPTLFEIKIFTGKLISHFSQYQTEDEILIKPYTKLKVLSVQGQKRIVNKNLYQFTMIRLLELPPPTMIPGHLVLWVDNSLIESWNNYNTISRDLKLDGFELIQIDSNEHLRYWFQAYRHLLGMPHVKIHFITNMNRTLQRKKEGIQTLEMIRKIDQNAPVVFFVNAVKQKQDDLNKRGWGNDKNILVVDTLDQIKEIFIKKFIP